MNKRQKLKHLQKLNAKHIEARLELSKALNSAIEDRELFKKRYNQQCKMNKDLGSIIQGQAKKIAELLGELNKPLLSRLWRWNK